MSTSDKIVRLVLALVFLALGTAARANGFANWAAVVVAGDDRAHDGSPSAIFDNARRGIVHDLMASGFSAQNIAEFSAAPHSAVNRPSGSALVGALQKLTRRARAGCLLYFTSHGSPEGMVLGNGLLAPPQLARLVAFACDGKPTVVVVSACFSGVFVPALAAKNRLILTAARRDRSSFGCGQTSNYPYFDECILSVWPRVNGFVELGRAARVCVAVREQREHVGPPSEPQLRAGAAIADTLPRWR